MVLHTDDYYEVLGVTTLCTDLKTIREAYKAAALKYHPDKTNGDPAATAIFLKIQRAYEVLNDPDLRKAYDRDHYPNIAKKKATAGQSQQSKPGKRQGSSSKGPPKPSRKEPPKPSPKMPPKPSQKRPSGPSQEKPPKQAKPNQHQSKDETPDMAAILGMYAGNRAAMLVIEIYTIWLQVTHDIESLKTEAIQEEQKLSDLLTGSLKDQNKTVEWLMQGRTVIGRIHIVNQIVSQLMDDGTGLESFKSWPFYPKHEVLSAVTNANICAAEKRLANIRNWQAHAQKRRRSLKKISDENKAFYDKK